MDIISINNTILTLFGYDVSLIELIGVLTGLISVLYAVKSNVLTWTLGIINALSFMIIFYQINLYSSMLLQVYFIIISFIGIFKWRDQENLKITNNKNNGMLFCYIILSSFLFYHLVCYLPEMIPNIFTMAKYPLIDSFVTITSIFAVSLMANKKIESWVLWILVDIISIFLYLSQGVLFLSIEYLIFLILAIIGYKTWKKQIYGKTI